MKKLTLITALFASAISLFAKDTRPNIIFFLADDMARNYIGVYGNEQVKTPTIDKLASDGVVFRNNYATTAICMASRASIMTGMYEYKTGCNFDKGPLWESKWQKSYPMLLREAGYYTGFAGKFGFAVKEDGTTSPSYEKAVDLPVKDFDCFLGEPSQTSYKTAQNKNTAKYAKQYPHSTRAYGAACVDFIREAKETGKPFCFSISFKASHLPFTPDTFFNNVYKATKWELPVNHGRENAKHFSMQARLGKAYLIAFPFYYGNQAQENLRKYNQLIYGVDYAINMVLEELEKQGIADNTIIIFTSDNGFNLGSHGFGHKAVAYEEGSKSPLVIYDPRAKKADTNWRESLVANIDIMPTILDYAGVEIPSNVDGKSLRDIIENPNAKIRESLPLFQLIESFPSVSMSIVTKDYKYIYYPYAEKLPAGEELYDLNADRAEMHNQINNPEFADILAKLKAYQKEELQAWKVENVKRASYEEFEIIFDQDIEWEEKRNHIPALYATAKGNYKYFLDRIGYKGDSLDYDAIMQHLDEYKDLAPKASKAKGKKK